MKKITRVVAIVMLLTGFFLGCGQDKYDDVVEINNEFIKVTQGYMDGLNKAESGKDVAKAMNKYADEFKKLAPKMKEIQKKYPDLMTAKDLPEKVTKSQAQSTQIGMDLAGSFMKVMKYMTDPEVVSAQQRMGEAMQSANK
ncbi:MAG: hypothetical protein GY699_24420 [Desulfobacteraceae bacterium]|nr:hypothetical protein [Desulfobacteraceae bacterium]